MNPSTPQPEPTSGMPYQPPVVPPSPNAEQSAWPTAPISHESVSQSAAPDLMPGAAAPDASAYPEPTPAPSAPSWQPPVSPSPQQQVVPALPTPSPTPWQQPTSQPRAPVYQPQPFVQQPVPVSQQPAAPVWNQPTANQFAAGPTQPQPAVDPAMLALGKLRKKVIRLIYAVAIFMGVAFGLTEVFLHLPAPIDSYSQSDLTSYNQNGTSFQYPEQWVDVTDQVSGSDAAYGDNADVYKASTLVAVQSEDEGIGPLDSLTSGQVSEFEANLKDEVKGVLFRDELEANSGCDSVDRTNVETAPASFSLKGVKFDFGCTRSVSKQKLDIVGYLGIAPSGRVYMIEIIGLDEAFQNNKTLFDTMLNSLKVD